jgi:hypothetical protein
MNICPPFPNFQSSDLPAGKQVSRHLLLQLLFSINFRHIFVSFIVFDVNPGLRRELLVPTAKI